MKRLKFLWLAVLLFSFSRINGQQITKAQLLFLTPEWKGERFADGRPKVPDSILNRMKLVTLEEAWAVLRNENYKQYHFPFLQRLNCRGYHR